MKHLIKFGFIIVFSFGLLQSCFNENEYIKNYFFEKYQPVPIENVKNYDPPKEHFIADVPWFCYKRNICQSVSFQMIASKYGINQPVDYYSLLLGYTYGATYVKGAGLFMPFSDPEPGFVIASPHLGLRREYLFTDSKEELLNSIRYFISQGYPVRIAWNSAPAMKFAVKSGYFPVPENWKEPSEKAFSPHSVVFVGYDSTAFYYYETQGKDFVLHGEKGIRIDEETVSKAILSFSATYKLPWKYMLTVFKADSTVDKSKEIWENVANEVVGRKFGKTSTGSIAIEGLSFGLDYEGTNIAKEPKKGMFKKTLQSLIDMRLSNVVFLEKSYPNENSITKAVQHFRGAINNYKFVLAEFGKDTLTKEDIEKMCNIINKASECENKAGMILLDLSKRQDINI